jgi:hypothetical protein
MVFYDVTLYSLITDLEECSASIFSVEMCSEHMAWLYREVTRKWSMRVMSKEMKPDSGHWDGG